MSQLPDWITDHLNLYLSDPEKAHIWTSPVQKDVGPVATLLLTTKGRISGKPLLLPLIYGRSGNGFVVVASKGGAPDHPGWYKNLVAEPLVDVQVAAKKFRAKARTASGAERAALWTQMKDIWPPYEAYAKRATAREIPVVVLEPVS